MSWVELLYVLRKAAIYLFLLHLNNIAKRLTVLLRNIFVNSFILRTWTEMKTIGSSAVLLVGSFILHFNGLGLSQSFGIIYSELLTFFDSGKSETSWIASLNSGLFLGCGKFVHKKCLFFVLQFFLSSVSVLHRRLLASCYRFSCYYRFSDIAINSVNPSFIWRLEFSKNA